MKNTHALNMMKYAIAKMMFSHVTKRPAPYNGPYLSLGGYTAPQERSESRKAAKKKARAKTMARRRKRGYRK